MISYIGRLVRVEDKPWKSDPAKSTTYVVLEDGGYTQKLQLGQYVERPLVDNLVGARIQGAVRILSNYDEAAKVVRISVVAVTVAPVDVPAAAAA